MECIDTLIGDIAPPADLMKTQTDRKIAEELERTYEVQREAQVKRQALERETAVANLQSEVVRSEQMVRVAAQNALAMAESARGEGNALKLRAEGHAASVRVTGEADAAALRAVGAAKAEAYRLGIVLFHLVSLHLPDFFLYFLLSPLVMNPRCRVVSDRAR